MREGKDIDMKANETATTKNASMFGWCVVFILCCALCACCSRVLLSFHKFFHFHYLENVVRVRADFDFFILNTHKYVYAQHYFQRAAENGEVLHTENALASLAHLHSTQISQRNFSLHISCFKHVCVCVKHVRAVVGHCENNKKDWKQKKMRTQRHKKQHEIITVLIIYRIHAIRSNKTERKFSFFLSPDCFFFFFFCRVYSFRFGFIFQNILWFSCMHSLFVRWKIFSN